MNSVNPKPLERFITVYGSLTAETVDNLDEIYSEAIEFIDPLHRISGLTDLKHYMKQMYANVSNYSIDIRSSIAKDNEAFLTWEMRFRHPKLRAGAMIEFEGTSHLRFEDKITFHRDYYDAGQMLYEHIPLIGTIIRSIKKRVQ